MSSHHHKQPTSCPPDLWSKLDGSQEVPTPVKTCGSGDACLEFASDFSYVKYIIQLTELSSPIREVIPGGGGAHFHCGGKGENGPVVHTINFIEINDIWWAAGQWNILDPINAIKLQTSNIYINVTTEKYPAGEIRGQVYPCCIKREKECSCCPKWVAFKCKKKQSCEKKKYCDKTDYCPKKCCEKKRHHGGHDGSDSDDGGCHHDEGYGGGYDGYPDECYQPWKYAGGGH